MHAQRHPQSAVSSTGFELKNAPELARQLLAANADYGQSNNPDLSLPARMQARQRARLALESILAQQPKHGLALSLLGRVELDGGRFDEARALFERSLTLEPDNAQCHTNLGYWALMTQDAARAEECFLAALALDRQSAAAFCGIAHAKRSQGLYDSAFLHYRKLLDMGLGWPSVFSGMMQCAEQLEIHQADGDLARDAIRLLGDDHLPHQSIGRFVAALLRQQYDLDNPNNEVFLDAAAGDDLLLLGLERTLLADPAVEELITHLRQSLLHKVMAEQHLADEHQRLAMALGQYAERTGYALLQSEVETVLVAEMNRDIAALLAQDATPEQLTGSVIVSAMYGALFNQSFASDLGRFALSDWAPGLQALVSLSYYNPAEDEAYKQNFPEKEAELLLAPEDVARAWPCWRNLRPMTQRLLRDEFRQTLGVQLDQAEPLRVMLLGCGSGQRALEIAHYYTDVEVIAVDEALANLAHGSRQAQARGLENIVFWPYSLARQFIGDGHQAQFIELGQMPSAQQQTQQQSLAALVEKALAHGGLVHMNSGIIAGSRADRQIQGLIREHQLPQTAASVRRLRRMVLNNRRDTDWGDLLESTDFYGMAGCRRRWFCPEDAGQTHALLGALGNEVEWRLVKARDSDGHDLATGPVQAQLLAERHGSEVTSLAGQALSLYFQKRR